MRARSARSVPLCPPPSNHAPVFIVFCCYLHTLSVSLLPTTHRQAEEKRRKRKRQIAGASKRCRAEKAAAAAEARAQAARASELQLQLEGAEATVGRERDAW